MSMLMRYLYPLLIQSYPILILILFLSPFLFHSINTYVIFLYIAPLIVPEGPHFVFSWAIYMPFPYRVILVSLLLHSFNCCTHSPIRHFAFVTLRSFPIFCHISFLFSFNAVPIILCHLMSNLVNSLDLLLSFSTRMVHSVVLKVSLYLFPF